MQPDPPFQIEPERPAPHAQREFVPQERIEFVRVRRARGYILRVRPDGSLRVTIPRSGSRAEAVAVLARQVVWIEGERARVRHEQASGRWTHGSSIQFDGTAVPIEITPSSAGSLAQYGGRSVRVKDPNDVRADTERDLRHLARERLVPRLHALAAQHGLTVAGVTIRNQRSRWGSCSRAQAIALNFRLVQMPPDVCDYVLIHELMHLRSRITGRASGRWSNRRARPIARPSAGSASRDGRCSRDARAPGRPLHRARLASRMPTHW